MADGKKQKMKCPEGVPEYMLTYGDMVTLLLCFFVLLFTTATVDGTKIRLIIASFNGLGILQGGNTLSPGILSELGQSVEALPSIKRARSLNESRREAVSQFQQEIKSNKVKLTWEERGLIISLAGDVLFDVASATVNIDQSREILQKLGILLGSLNDRDFRIEGHTDSLGTDPAGRWPTNWELSAERAINVMHYLVEYGADEQRMQVAGFADTKPFTDNTTAEGRAYNRRVDIVILNDGHL